MCRFVLGPIGRCTPEVDLGIAVAAVIAGHRVGLGLGRFGVIPRGTVGPGRAARIVWRCVEGLRLEALHQGSGLDQRPIDQKVVVDNSGATS